MKLIVSVLCILILTSNVAIVQAIGVQDVEGHWAGEKIQNLVDEGLITGYPDNTFKPDNYITRAEFISLVNRVFGFSEYLEVDYSDVKPSDWFYLDVGKALKNGYLLGYENNTIRPNLYISRQEVAVIITKLLDLDINTNAKGLIQLVDSGDIPLWSSNQVNVAMTNGFMTGYPDNTFRPTKKITRAEAIVTMSRILEHLEKPVNLFEAGKYSLGIVGKGVVIEAGNVLLTDTVIRGDLIISDLVKDGDVTLNNVIVEGKLYINSQGNNEIQFTDCQIREAIIDKEDGKVSLIAKGSTEIPYTIIKSETNLEERELTDKGFIEIHIDKSIPEKVEVRLSGDFEKLTVASQRIKVTLTQGTIEEIEIINYAENNEIDLSPRSRVQLLVINSQVDVRGKGKIKKVVINVNGVRIEQRPSTVVLAKGIKANVGYGISDDDKAPVIDEEKILNKVKDSLELTVQDAKGRDKTPKIVLPATDSYGYRTEIIWKSENIEYITIEDNVAIVYRRGSSSNEGSCGDHEDINTQITGLQQCYICNNGITILSDDEGGCSGSGGNITTANLIATISNGSQSVTRAFKVNIPWGWGKDVTIGDKEEKDSCDDSNLEPKPIYIDEQILRLNGYPLILMAEDLAQNGKKIIDASVDGDDVVQYEILPDGRLKIIPKDIDIPEIIEPEIIEPEIIDLDITDPEVAESEDIEEEIAEEEVVEEDNIEEPETIGEAEVTALVHNKSGEVECKFTVIVKRPKEVIAEVAVDEAYDNLNLAVYTRGEGTKQTNKISLPNTDRLGYQTEIVWEVDNEEFVTIAGEDAIIHRRGNKNEGGSDGGSCEDHSVVSLLSLGEIRINCGDNSGDCDAEDGGQSGMSIMVQLRATIKRGFKEKIKEFTITIPWGWGRDITIE